MSKFPTLGIRVLLKLAPQMEAFKESIEKPYHSLPTGRQMKTTTFCFSALVHIYALVTEKPDELKNASERGKTWKKINHRPSCEKGWNGNTASKKKRIFVLFLARWTRVRGWNVANFFNQLSHRAIGVSSTTKKLVELNGIKKKKWEKLANLEPLQGQWSLQNTRT